VCKLKEKVIASEDDLRAETYKRQLMCTIWDDVRTYLTSTIDPNEKTALLVAISRFKNEVKQ